jgi:hypothetical protein
MRLAPKEGRWGLPGGAWAQFQAVGSNGLSCLQKFKQFKNYQIFPNFDRSEKRFPLLGKLK